MTKDKDKKKNENKKNKEFNKKYLIIGSIVTILAIAVIAVICIMCCKNKDVNDIIVSDLTYVAPLKESDEVQAAKLIKENIVRITNKISDKKSIIGTGFFIKEGYLITNSHVVDIMGDISIQYFDGSTSKAYLFSNSIENDIAILKVEKVPVKALVFGDSNKVEVTNDVLAAGFIYNFAGEATVSKGILSARRTSNNMVYLQSDLSIDTGASGGPLFNANAEVIGINTYVTDNRTFSLTMSSEAVSMVIDVLLDTPNVEYLTEKRPSNPINKILVEVGYTVDENLDLYADSELIKISYEANEEKIEETTKNNDESTSVTYKYYCKDDGYTLIGKKCVKQVTYDASLKEYSCKEGYTKEGDQCVKNYVIDAKAEYYCNGKLSKTNKCVKKSLQVRGYDTYNDRWGSCPKGKTCYDLGVNFHTNTVYNKFVTQMVCPAGGTLIKSGNKIVWSNQEYVEENFKTWKSSIPGAFKETDSDGLVTYKDSSNILAMCAKSYDSTNNVYTVYTYDELKDVACPNGGKLTANTNNQGFYCLVSTQVKRYAWDVTCADTADSVIQENSGALYCGQYVDTVYTVAPTYRCEKGSLRGDGETCFVEDIYDLPREYYCENGGNLHGRYCMKTKTVDAIKK